MNNEFEKQLSEQPRRAPPAPWRTEILREARITAARQLECATTVPGWRSWLWPAPKMWAALAACWIVLLVANAFNQPEYSPSTEHSDTRALMAALAEKRCVFQEMDIAVVVNPVHHLQGASGWLHNNEKGVLPC
jgi:hypothetical protein